MKLKPFFFAICALTPIFSIAQNNPIYQSKAYSVYPDKVVEGDFTAKISSNTKITSNYVSRASQHYSSTVTFKFSINGRDNELPSGNDHQVTLTPENGVVTTDMSWGKRVLHVDPKAKNVQLPENTRWIIKLDMREVLSDFKNKGYFVLFNGEKLYKNDFKAVYIAGSSLPLIWDFNNLKTQPELELKDPDGDGIYKTTLIMNRKNLAKHTDPVWILSKDISKFPVYKSSYPVSDAIYKLSTEEMIKAVEPDSTFRTGKEWAGVWTRDISYSIILSMAYLQPKVAKYSLMRKVKNGFIIQDTGTGGAYPVSTDRMIWATAAWELYKATGDNNWLNQAYPIIKKSIEADMVNAYDEKTGLVKGESSFLDWREETYPRWMQPADIYESECLGTNAVHYQANIVLAQMAEILGEKEVAQQHFKIAERIKNGINQYLWMEDKGYYAQYLYGHNYKTISPRSEALGEALCVIFGIANAEKSKKVIAHTPVVDYGIPCIFPLIPNIPPYHNDAVWPFVQAYWGIASAHVGNEKSVLESIAAIYRPAALFLTNKENFVAGTGDFAGTQINSSNMLWSLSGNLALVHKILFGINIEPDSIRFNPFVPKVLAGNRQLTNFKIRNAILNIEMSGYGNKIENFEIDGAKTVQPVISTKLTGMHSIKISLSNNDLRTAEINKTTNYTAPETPVVVYKTGRLSWNEVDSAEYYHVLRNGKNWKKTNKSSIKVSTKCPGEYQVISVDKNGVNSFASEPVSVTPPSKKLVYQAEEFAPLSVKHTANDFQGKGYIEISKGVNEKVLIPVTIRKKGNYAISFRYANGNGPINTDNKCAIRSLTVDGKLIGTYVFPQRGSNEWSNWGSSNSIQTLLSKGKHNLEIIFGQQNENMNSETNEALIDELIIIPAGK